MVVVEEEDEHDALVTERGLDPGETYPAAACSSSLRIGTGATCMYKASLSLRI